jgi:putative flavoprotein involved in K+ transport
MNGSILEVIVVGAGHAGLSLSYYLKHLGLEHMVFERGRIGESWRSQRWNSLTLNTVNRLNALPGSSHKIKKPEKFGTPLEFVNTLELYVSGFQLPVSENSNVLSVQKPTGSPYFIVTVSHENEPPRTYNSWQVVIASGSLNQKTIPSFASAISADVQQIHSSEYKDPSQIQDGAILVVGSGQSGCQITEELLEAGRTVFFSTSKVPRVPRRYRGKDIMDWLIEAKYYEMRTNAVSDTEMLTMREPVLSGLGDGHTISLQHLASKGAILTGTMKDGKDHDVLFEPNALEHVKYADDFSSNVKEMIDTFIRKIQQEIPEPEVDEADLFVELPDLVAPITSLNLPENNIKAIVWATGLKGDFDFIKLPVLDGEGVPKHDNGSTGVEGLYFIGLPWLRSRKSNLICGIKDDAGFISNKIYSSLR